MSFPFMINDAVGVPVSSPVQVPTEKKFTSGKCHLRVLHLNQLPDISCDDSLTSDVEQVQHLTRSLAKAFNSTGCERYLLPPLAILTRVWNVETEPLYRAFHALRDYGYMVIVPGCNGDITVNKIY